MQWIWHLTAKYNFCGVSWNCSKWRVRCNQLPPEIAAIIFFSKTASLYKFKLSHLRALASGSLSCICKYFLPILCIIIFYLPIWWQLLPILWYFLPIWFYFLLAYLDAWNVLCHRISQQKKLVCFCTENNLRASNIQFPMKRRPQDVGSSTSKWLCSLTRPCRWTPCCSNVLGHLAGIPHYPLALVSCPTRWSLYWYLDFCDDHHHPDNRETGYSNVLLSHPHHPSLLNPKHATHPSTPYATWEVSLWIFTNLLKVQ